MSEELPEFSVFPNGTSYVIWHERNCSRCWKCPGADHTGHNKKCAIEDAIAFAAVTDGSLLHDGVTSREKAAVIAARLNWDGISYLENDCPEREEKRPPPAPKPKTDKVDDLPLFKP